MKEKRNMPDNIDVKSLLKELNSLRKELKGKEKELAGFREKLKDNDKLFFELIKDASYAYQSLDEDGCFLAVNDTWLEIFGYTKEEVIGKWFGDFIASEHVEQFRNTLPSVQRIGQYTF